MMTRAEAIAEVSLFCDATAYPQLSTTEIGSALDSFERFTTWTAATAYAVGDRVVPVVPTLMLNVDPLPIYGWPCPGP